MSIAAFESLRADHGRMLRAMLDQSQDCVKLINIDGELEYMNPNGRKAMAVPDVSEVVGTKWVDVWPEESRDLVAEAMTAALSGTVSRFEAYCPTMAGEPRWWDVSVSPIRDDDGAIEHVLATSRDITVQNAERQSERDRRARAESRAEMRDAISREMRHRVKNLLAVVLSVSRLTARQRPKTSDFLSLFERRIDGLAAAQRLLIEHEHQRASLPGLMDTLIEVEERDERIAMGKMPDVTIDDRAAQTVALVIGELLTNAYKHGALGRPAGQIFITAIRSRNQVRLVWEEDCGEAIEPSSEKGSGSELMRRISAGQPKPVSIEWQPTGIKASFAVAI